MHGFLLQNFQDRKLTFVSTNIHKLFQPFCPSHAPRSSLGADLVVEFGGCSVVLFSHCLHHTATHWWLPYICHSIKWPVISAALTSHCPRWFSLWRLSIISQMKGFC